MTLTLNLARTRKGCAYNVDHRPVHTPAVMRPLLILFFLFVLAADASAQDEAPIAGQRLPTQITLIPVYQQYDHDALSLSEFSTTLNVFVPVTRNLGLSLRAGQAQVTGDLQTDDPLTDLSGLGDVQLSATYFQEIGAASLVAGLAANLPSGKQQLTPDEFQTLTLLSRTVYDFQMPSFGQGFGFSPSLTLAMPLGDRFALGLGASYQYRGGFEPLDEMQDDYDPGDEVLLTVGFDVGLAPQMSVSGDVSYTGYGTDRRGDEEVYAAGSKVVLTGQYRARWGFDGLWVVARHRIRGKGELLAAGASGEASVLPTQTDVLMQYTRRVGEPLDLGVLGEARFFEETDVLPGASVFGVGVAPVLRVSRRVEVPARFVYNLGDLSGLEAALGVRIKL